jgi:hypothetical protein
MPIKGDEILVRILPKDFRFPRHLVIVARHGRIVFRADRFRFLSDARHEVPVIAEVVRDIAVVGVEVVHARATGQAVEAHEAHHLA